VSTALSPFGHPRDGVRRLALAVGLLILWAAMPTLGLHW